MDAMKLLGSLLGDGSMATGRSGNALGELLQGALGAGAQSGGGAGLGELLGGALGGGGSGGGGLGDLLGGALAGGGSGATGGGGGLGELLGAALGGGSSSRGSSIGGVLGSVAMAALARYAAGKMAGPGGGMPDLGALLGGGGRGPQGLAQLDSAQMNSQAELLIDAMIGAAKADGRVDASEERAIVDRLGDLDADERAFLRSRLQAPADAAGLAARVPASMAREVYAASLLAMDLDERSEALYLRDLARGLHLDAATCNAIHREMGEPELFR